MRSEGYEPGARGESGERLPSEAKPISQRIEVILTGNSSYHVTVEQAWELVRAGDAKWLNRKQIERKPDKRIECTWAVRGKSALYSEGMGFGPKFCTLQVVT